MNNIKPCPFCGETKVEILNGGHFKYRIAQCQVCGAQGPEVKINVLDPDHEAKGEAEAISEWNTRQEEKSNV